MVRKVLLGLAACLGVAVFYFIISDNGWLHVHRLQQEKAKLERRLDELELQKVDYEKKAQMMAGDPLTIEREIREQLKYVRAEETVFVMAERMTTPEP